MAKEKVSLLCLLIFMQLQAFVYPAEAAVTNAPKGKSKIIAPIFEHQSDPFSAQLAPDALQLVGFLGMEDRLKRLIVLNDAPKDANQSSLLESYGLKFEVLETVQEARLQMDFVLAEIDEELCFLEEALRIYSDDRDDRVNRANQRAFRTNGALWAVAEALTMPTYKSPKLSIPSGAVGIVAGIIPSIFSEYALRASSGDHYARKAYPNVLSCIFDMPLIPRITFPEIVLKYFNSCPQGEQRTRKEILRQRWQENKNIRTFRGGMTQQKLMLLTGNVPYTSDLEFCRDRVIMLKQVRSTVWQMSRPLLEICQVARGKKRFAEPGSALQ